MTSIYLALVLALFYWCHAGLNPAVLWNDDIWTAGLLKYGSIAEIFQIAPPLSIGFVALQKLMLQMIPNPTLATQIAPLGFGIAAVLLFSVTVWDLTYSKSLSTAGFLILASNRQLVEYFFRNKTYGLDIFFSVLILSAAVFFFKNPRASSLFRLWVYALVAIFFSSSSIFTAVPILCITLPYLKSFKNTQRIVIGCLAILALLYHQFYLSFQARAAMTDYWAEYLHPTRHIFEFFSKALPTYLRDFIFLVPLGVFVLWQRKSFRPIAFAYLFFIFFIILMAAFKKYPLGGGRTDLYSYPVHVSLFLFAIWHFARIRWLKFLAPALVIFSAYKFFHLITTQPLTYLDDPDAKIGKDAAIENKSLLFIHRQQAKWAYCYYNQQNVCHLIKDEADCNGFRLELNN